MKFIASLLISRLSCEPVAQVINYGYWHVQSIINGTNMVSIQTNTFVCTKWSMRHLAISSASPIATF